MVPEKTVAFVPVYSVLHDAKAVEETLSRYLDRVNSLPFFSFRQKEREELRPEEEAIFFVVTGGSEELVLETLPGRPDPVLLLAHPDMNSLPAALEIMARLTQLGRHGQVIYLTDDETASLKQLDIALRVISTYRRMHGARLGLIGRPSDWLVASSPQPELVTRVWGPEVVTIAMDEVLRRLEAAEPAAVKDLTEEFLAQASGVLEPAPQDLERAAAVYLALRQVVDTYHLDALSIRRQ
ncbi:MAG: hypothetical protein M1553_07810 [Firmicutes bacterium]|nr:hypothetical protein [Bacillota bacterium]